MRIESGLILRIVRYPDRVISMFLFLFCFFIFSPVLDNYFLLDDGQWLLLGKQVVSNWAGIFEKVGGAYFEPVLNVLFGAAFSLFHFQPSGYYALNVFLHSLNTVLLYSVSRHLSSGDKTGAVFSALLFGVLFAHYQPVLWIAAFVHLISALFVMVCLIFFVRYVRDGKAVHYYSCFAVFLTGLLAKESVIMLPFVLASYFWLFSREKAPSVSWRKLVPFFVLACVYFLCFHSRGISMQTKHVGFGYVLGFHFFPTLVSCGMEIVLTSMGYVTVFGRSLGKNALGFNAGALILLFVLSFLYPGKRNGREKAAVLGALFGVMCFFVLLLPFSFFLELRGYGSFHRYRYLYLPSIGFCLSFGHFLSLVMRRVLGESKLKWCGLILAGVILNISFLNVKYIQIAERHYSMYGKISKRVVGQIGSLIEGTPPAELYLLDFPETPVLAMSKPHIASFVRLFYGEGWSVFMMRKEELKAFHPDKSVYLVYRNGRVEIYGKEK